MISVLTQSHILQGAQGNKTWQLEVFQCGCIEVSTQADSYCGYRWISVSLLCHSAQCMFLLDK